MTPPQTNVVLGISDRYVSSLLPLALLAPEISEAIAAGTQPADVTAHQTNEWPRPELMTISEPIAS